VTEVGSSGLKLDVVCWMGVFWAVVGIWRADICVKGCRSRSCGDKWEMLE